MDEFESLNWVEIKPLNLAKLTDFGETQEGFKIEMEKELVTITKEEYESLLDDALWRRCLEAGGVDSWEWYSESLNDGGYYDEDEE